MLKMLADWALPLLWLVFWVLGGIWITRAIFNLRRSEQILVGISTGLVLEACLANLGNRMLPPLFADLSSAGAIFTAGLILQIRSGQSPLKSFPLTWNWLFLPGLAWFSFALQHGLSINGDALLLAETSKIAAGELARAPLSLYAPSLPLFTAAALQHLGGLFPWNALDLVRAMMASLGILLCGAWTRRMTRSQIAGWLAVFFGAFASGAGWLVLLFPNDTLLAALKKPPSLPFNPPMPLPDYFSNAWLSPLSLTFSPDFFIALICAACLLLTFNRWKHKPGGTILSIILLSSGINTPLSFNSLLFAGCVLLIAKLPNRQLRHPPAGYIRWMVITFVSLLLAGINIRGFLQSPALLSGLGTDTSGLVLAFIRLVPVMCILPIGLYWGFRAFRAGRWLEMLLLASALPALFWDFSPPLNGTDYSDGQFYSFGQLLPLFLLYAPALVWLWAEKRSQTARILAAVWAATAVLGGVLCFAISLTALNQVAFPPGMTSIDALAYTDFWNDPHIHAYEIYDPNPQRSEVVFGRPVSSPNTIPVSPHVFPSEYRYLYLDESTWNQLDPASREKYIDPCVKLVKEYPARRGGAFRRLLDLSACH